MTAHRSAQSDLFAIKLHYWHMTKTVCESV